VLSQHIRYLSRRSAGSQNVDASPAVNKHQPGGRIREHTVACPRGAHSAASGFRARVVAASEATQLGPSLPRQRRLRDSGMKMVLVGARRRTQEGALLALEESVNTKFTHEPGSIGFSATGPFSDPSTATVFVPSAAQLPPGSSQM